MRSQHFGLTLRQMMVLISSLCLQCHYTSMKLHTAVNDYHSVLQSNLLGFIPDLHPASTL